MSKKVKFEVPHMVVTQADGLIFNIYIPSVMQAIGEQNGKTYVLMSMYPKPIHVKETKEELELQLYDLIHNIPQQKEGKEHGKTTRK